MKKTKKRKAAPPRRPKRMPRGRPFREGNELGKAYWFRKGQSGNPLGGTKYAEISKALRGFLALELSVPLLVRTHAEKVAYKLLHHAEKGKLAAISELCDRAEGRPSQAVRIESGNDPLAQLIKEMERESRSIGPPEEQEDTGSEIVQ